MNHKVILRKLILDCRKLLSEYEFQKRNDIICQQTLSLIQEKDFKSIHVFLPIKRNREVDLLPIFPPLWKDGRKIMVSKTDFKSKTMTHFWLDKDTELVKNKFEIPEPLNAPAAEIQQSDLIIVPLLIADHAGNRLGYGGGFYDRLLSDYTGHSVGLCLSPLLDHLGTDKGDIPVKQMLFYQPVDSR